MGAKRAGRFWIGVVAVAALGVSAIASATFPGTNGRIAFTDGADIFTMNPDGSDVRQLTSVPPGDITCCEEWSADGRSIAYTVQSLDGLTSQLWIMNADGSNQRLLFDDPEGYDIAASLSPDEQFVVFTRCPVSFFPDYRCAISRIRSDGTDLTSITHIDPDPDVEDFDPVYSPDGGTIAFSSTARGGLTEAFYLMNADGSNIRTLTAPALGAAKPDWAPDGRRVAFFTGFFNVGDASPCQGNDAIGSIRVDGSDEKLLTGSPDYSDAFPAWSPEGGAIVFARTDAQGLSSIYIVDLGRGGATPRLLFQSGARRVLPRPSASRVGAKSKNRPYPIEAGGTSPRWGTAP
jgi:Tol biopolymer transport system component